MRDSQNRVTPGIQCFMISQEGTKRVDRASYSLSSLKGLDRGLYRAVSKGLLRDILGV